MDTRTLLLLIVGAGIVYLCVHNPALGAALATAVAVVLLLNEITKE
ncbi:MULTISPECIES: hypothetical protein [Streptomycetaceae]|nr:hypothetical protein [Streptomyces sp. CB02056]